MLERSLSIFALHAIWDSLRAEYPTLELRVIGRVNKRIKELVPPRNGIEYIDYIDDVDQLQALGAQAVALVHLVIGDHSPNTVCEIIGEGRPAIVLDKGGARETAGRAGIVVATEPSREQTDLDNWWALDGRTYRPNLDSLRAAVLLALENPRTWQRQAQKRAGEIGSPEVAKRYMEFMQNLTSPPL
jgi:glycosyltransferase involved in cell wall biosynthesis